MNHNKTKLLIKLKLSLIHNIQLKIKITHIKQIFLEFAVYISFKKYLCHGCYQ